MTAVTCMCVLFNQSRTPILYTCNLSFAYTSFRCSFKFVPISPLRATRSAKLHSQIAFLRCISSIRIGAVPLLELSVLFCLTDPQVPAMCALLLTRSRLVAAIERISSCMLKALICAIWPRPSRISIDVGLLRRKLLAMTLRRALVLKRQLASSQGALRDLLQIRFQVLRRRIDLMYKITLLNKSHRAIDYEKSSMECFEHSHRHDC